MATLENVPHDNKVRAALHRDVRSICIECCHFLGLDITKNAMEIIAELLFMKLSVHATDLEAFAKHAKRTQVNTDDVKLLVRRNPTLKSHLNTICSSHPATKEKRRKTIANIITKQILTPTKTTDSLPAATKPKESMVQPSTSSAVENMLIDDAIDLTFEE